MQILQTELNLIKFETERVQLDFRGHRTSPKNFIDVTMLINYGAPKVSKGVIFFILCEQVNICTVKA